MQVVVLVQKNGRSPPPLSVFLLSKPLNMTSPVVHPIGLFGATFGTDPDTWPSMRPEWTRKIADAIREFNESGGFSDD